MIFTESPLNGAFVIELEPHRDERGWFARTYCRQEFEKHGIKLAIAQSNLSLSLRAGTLRGMHFQRELQAEAKLVRCVRGSIHDVVIDLRPDSRTYREHFALELSDDIFRALFIPEGFAHGFQSLADETMVEYQMGNYYSADDVAGYRYDDPAFAISWPRPVSTISKQDLAWPPFAA